MLLHSNKYVVGNLYLRKVASCETTAFFRICVVTVAKRHPVLNSGDVVKVDFQVSKKVNRLDNKVSGKRKKGGQYLLPHSPLCEVTCSTGEKFSLFR